MIKSQEQAQPVNTLQVKRKAAARTSEWGWLPALTLTASFGLMVVSVANMRWRVDAVGANSMFWIGLLIIFIPFALRQLYPDVSRKERMALVIVLAMTLYAVKLLNSPITFKNFDELLHYRTATDIIQTGTQFTYHPVLPISPYYPGMENIVSALNQIGGLDIYWAGVVLVGMARMTLVITLFMFYRRVSGSGRLAGIATLFYMANPSFLYFDAMFSYESLALAFAGLALFAITRWLYARHNQPFSLMLVMAIAMGAVIVTHHLTTYALLAVVILWAIVDTLHRYLVKDGDQPHVGWTPAIFALVLAVVWILYVAPTTVNYLAPEINDAILKMVGFITGESGGRELFSSELGEKAPLIEQISGYAAFLLIMVLLGLGLLQIWMHRRKNIPFIMLGVGAIGYPVSQAFRLVQINADIPGRSVEFIFVALALVMAVGLVDYALPYIKRVTKRQYVVTAVACGIIFMGSAAVGWKPLPPGSYMVSASTRSVDELSVVTAQWFQNKLGSDHRIAADRINGVLMVAYGHQYQVTLSEDWIQIPDLFLSNWIGPEEAYVLWEGEVEYLVVDQRLSTGLPYLGFYFEQSENGAFSYTEPLDPAVLSKFDNMGKVTRLYDNGNIRIYDVKGLWNEP